MVIVLYEETDIFLLETQRVYTSILVVATVLLCTQLVTALFFTKYIYAGAVVCFLLFILQLVIRRIPVRPFSLICSVGACSFESGPLALRFNGSDSLAQIIEVKPDLWHLVVRRLDGAALHALLSGEAASTFLMLWTAPRPAGGLEWEPLDNGTLSFTDDSKRGR